MMFIREDRASFKANQLNYEKLLVEIADYTQNSDCYPNSEGNL